MPGGIEARRPFEPGSPRIFSADAIVISAGNDGSFALSHSERICKGYRLKKVQEPIVCKDEVTEEVLTRCVELGSTIAEGVNAGLF